MFDEGSEIRLPFKVGSIVTPDFHYRLEFPSGLLLGLASSEGFTRTRVKLTPGVSGYLGGLQMGFGYTRSHKVQGL